MAGLNNASFTFNATQCNILVNSYTNWQMIPGLNRRLMVFTMNQAMKGESKKDPDAIAYMVPFKEFTPAIAAIIEKAKKPEANGLTLSDRELEIATWFLYLMEYVHKGMATGVSIRNGLVPCRVDIACRDLVERILASVDRTAEKVA